MAIHSFFTYSYIICVRVLGYINAGSFSDCGPVCLVFYTYVMKCVDVYMLRQVRRACSVLPCEAYRLKLNFSVVHRLQRFVRLV